jgi:plastocyanin
LRIVGTTRKGERKENLMRGVHFAFAALLGAIALAAVGCGGGGGGSSSSTTESTTTTGTESSTTTTSATGTTQLIGADGEESSHDAFTITLKKDDGSDVTTLPAGSYTLLVHDYSAIHNFHLSGPGVDVSTDVGGTGDKTFDITLQAGDYKYVCDPHASQMNGSFTVTG